MNVLIILGHPNNKSFNHSMAEACREKIEVNGHTVLFHDLYAEKFDPIHHNENSDINDNIKLHCSHLKSCDAIIVIHPNWWGQPPAIIKGWIDRVLLPGVAYDFELNENGDFNLVGLLKAKVGLILNTSNSPNNMENNALDAIWKNNVLNTCGVNDVKRINFGMVNKSDVSQRTNWLLEVKQLINSLFPTNK